MKKRLTALVLVLVMALSLCACGGDKTDGNQATGNSDYTGPSYTLTLGHVIADGTPTDEGADHFAQLVSEASGGKIKIEVYPNSALGDNRAMIESVQQGTLDMVLPAVANLAAFTTATKLFDLPFLFKNDAHAEAVLDGEVGTKILSDLESSGLVGLAWWLQGWRELTTDNIEFHKAGDLNGCKMRVQDNEVHIMTWQLLGASPTTLAYSELFTALQQGTITQRRTPSPTSSSPVSPKCRSTSSRPTTSMTPSRSSCPRRLGINSIPLRRRSSRRPPRNPLTGSATMLPITMKRPSKSGSPTATARKSSSSPTRRRPLCVRPFSPCTISTPAPSVRI